MEFDKLELIDLPMNSVDEDEFIFCVTNRRILPTCRLGHFHMQKTEFFDAMDGVPSIDKKFWCPGADWQSALLQLYSIS